MKNNDRVVLTSFGRKKFPTDIIDVDDMLTILCIKGDYIECRNTTKGSSFSCYLYDIKPYNNDEIITSVFIVNKWYKINDNWYARFFSIYDYGKFWGFSESISVSGNYCKSHNRLLLKNGVIELLEDLREIQEFLPNDHIDKIEKITKNSEKLESFPEEGYCLTNSPVIRSYLSSRPGNVLAINKAWDETKHIGVGWNLKGHWPVSEKSPKKLYALEELMPFIKLLNKSKDRKAVILDDENEFEEFLERFDNPLKLSNINFKKEIKNCVQVSEKDIHYTGCISDRKFFESCDYKVITYKEWLQENNFYIGSNTTKIHVETPVEMFPVNSIITYKVQNLPRFSCITAEQLKNYEIELKLIKVEHI